MTYFDHTTLVQTITQNLAPLRKTQPDPMQAFGQLAKLAMLEGVVSAKTKELIALQSALRSIVPAALAFTSKPCTSCNAPALN